MPNTLSEQVQEFLAASRDPHSYHLLKNVYIWFGILWGLPIPLASTLFQALLIESRDMALIAETIIHTPIQYLFFAHPLIFGILFGILGTVRHNKDQEVNKLIDELRTISILDPLTGLSNRRYFTQEFTNELARMTRKRTSLSLIFLDLDHFKKVNDRHGHRMGDEVLRQTAALLRSRCRPYDIPARWGGEEFVILLPETREEMAVRFAERLRADFTDPLSSAIPFTVTVSIGVCEHRPGDTLESFTERADLALYQAKATGRNKVVCWSELSQHP